MTGEHPMTVGVGPVLDASPSRPRTPSCHPRRRQVRGDPYSGGTRTRRGVDGLG